MTTRQNLGFKGPVWKVSERWEPPYESSAEFEFDPDGTLVFPPSRPSEVRETESGWVEIRPLGGAEAWSRDGLNGVSFYTRDAAVSETSVTRDGLSERTVFKDTSGQEISHIEYVCDAKGRILEARQHHLRPLSLPEAAASRLPPGTTKGANEVLAAMTGAEADVRVTFTYDAAGRVLEQASYIGGLLHEKTVSTYNENGDRVRFISMSEKPYDIEYEYDTQMNWVRQIVRHPDGLTEGRRHITYYEDRLSRP